MTHTDTIAAIATPHGTASTGLIRVSGPEAGELAKQLFRPSRPGCEWLSHHLYHGDLLAGDGITLLDEALVTLMRGPHSFTGEDVLEISCHGNPLILKSILERLMELGCRPARPGEFTQRAFLNGRMDLSQAEALATLICAQSEKARRIGLEQLKGSLGCRIGELRSMLIDAMAMLEVLIDFGEDVPPEDVPKPQMLIAQARKEFESLLSTCRQAKFITAGFEAIIIGKPNVGKSTFISRVSAARPKIADYPFTTLVPNLGVVSCGEGRSFVIADIPGLVEGAHEGVGMGIRFLRHVERTRVLFHILDLSREPYEGAGHDFEVVNRELARFSPEMIEKPQIVGVNKIDLPVSRERLKNAVDFFAEKGIRILPFSAATGEGLPEILKTMMLLLQETDTPERRGGLDEGF